jgi:hypothetical protein
MNNRFWGYIRHSPTPVQRTRVLTSTVHGGGKRLMVLIRALVYYSRQISGNCFVPTESLKTRTKPATYGAMKREARGGEHRASGVIIDADAAGHGWGGGDECSCHASAQPSPIRKVPKKKPLLSAEASCPFPTRANSSSHREMLKRGYKKAAKFKSTCVALNTQAGVHDI